MRRKRHRVALRPKVRGQRLRQRAALATLVLLGGGAFATARHFGRSLTGLSILKGGFPPAVTAIEAEGVPDELKGKIALSLAAAPGSVAQRVEAAAREYPYLKTISVRRDWLRRTALLRLEPRRAVALVARDGRPAGFLSDDGVVFGAPEDLFPGLSSTVEPGAAGEERLRDLAAYLLAVGRSDALPSPLRRMRFVSEAEGWEVSLKDGTRLLWGELVFTEEKLGRLREILADARGRFEGLLTADLRYFEDGKVLLHPLAQVALKDAPAGARGGVR